MEIMKGVILIVIGIGAYLFIFDKDKLNTVSEEIREFFGELKEKNIDSLNVLK